MGIYLIFGLVALASWLVRQRFQSVMKSLSQQRTSSNLTGQQIAQRMLQHYHVPNVQITATGGMLTDHYNPGNRTVNLSEGVYQQPSIAAAAVAAHECGHAVQHAKAYSFLQMRSALVPVVSVASRFSPWLLLAGIFTLQTFPQIMLLGIIALAGSTLFSFITLPVEFDASKRALAYLESSGLARGEELAQAKKGLDWAAMTYVVAALGSLATLIYYATIFMRSQD